MAWLDMRTTSAARGGWPTTSRTCRPGSSRRSAARPPTGPAPPRGSWSTSSGPAPRTATIDGREPARLADHAGRAGALLRQGRDRDRLDPPARPAAAAGEQQLQGVRQRRRAGRLQVTTRPGPYGTNAEPYDGRPASHPGRLQLPGRQAAAPSGRPRCARSRGRWRPATCDLRPECQAVQITHDAQRQGQRRRVPRRRRATCTGRPPGWSAWPATRSSRRGCC